MILIPDNFFQIILNNLQVVATVHELCCLVNLNALEEY